MFAVAFKGTMNLSLLFQSFSYNCTRGTFVVPINYVGLYQFSMHLLVQNGEYPSFQVRHNSRNGSAVLCNTAASFTKMVVGDGTAEPGEAQISIGHTTVSCSALAEVNEGDQVYVWYWNRNFIPLSTQPGQSAFSGFFIKSYNRSIQSDYYY